MTELAFRRLRVAIILVVFVLLASTGALIIYSNNVISSKIISFTKPLLEFKEFTAQIDFSKPLYFSFDRTKVTFDANGARLKPQTENADIILLSPLKVDPTSKLTGFKEDTVKDRNSQVSYQITSDYRSWYYYDGRTWAKANDCATCTNNAVEISRNISKFPVVSNGIQIKAFLKSNGGNLVLKSVTLKIKGTEVLKDVDQAQQLYVRAAFAGKDKEEEPQITICHSTASDTNPYVVITVDQSAADGEGANDHTSHIVEHGRNFADIIPITDLDGNGEINDADCLYNCVDICHNPDQGNQQPYTLCVPPSNVAAHLSHGDNQGACGVVPAVCGNGILETPEECDDNNTADNDGCSALCLIEGTTGPVCGNGILETGEECDDSNTNNGDGCAANCVVEGPSGHVCGNGVIEDPENCDPQALPTGCAQPIEICLANSCQCQVPICHATGSQTNPFTFLWVDYNSVDGLGVNDHTGHDGDIIPIWDLNNDQIINDADCQSIQPVCGNNIVETGEQCDDGNTQDSDGCSSQCIYEYCGDNVVQPGLDEQCDDGNTDDNDGCSGLCLYEYCGDNIVQSGLQEQCDDGNTTSNDGCSSQCQIEGDQPVCGNNILEQGEECDDGNTANGDGCSSQCSIEGGGGPSCGDGIIDNNENCDYRAQPSGCAQGIETCQDNCHCRVPICHATASEQNPYTMLWVDYSSVDGEGANDHTGHDGDIIPIWDVDNNGEINDQDCVASQYQCGNEIIEPGEECDDGNLLNEDGCSSTCQIEEWDLSNIEVSGQCTEGNIITFIISNTGEPLLGDMIGSSNYRVYRNNEIEKNNTEFTLAGGESITVTVNNVNADLISLEADQRPGHPGPSITSSQVLCDAGSISAIDDSETTNINVPVQISVLNNDFFGENQPPILPGLVVISIITNPGHGSVAIDPVTGIITYTPDTNFTGPDTFIYQICDISNPENCDTAVVTILVRGGGGGTGGGGGCGNGTIESPELCDDGNNLSGDGCSNTCTIEPTPICGNNIIEAPEQCDDANTISGDGCSATCTREGGTPSSQCGDGVIQGNEQCDDNNLISGDGCSAVCTIETPAVAGFCGNGILETPEECDDGNINSGDGCSETCTAEIALLVIELPAPVCGNAVIEAGETCDDGNVTPGDGCSAICIIEPPVVGGTVGITAVLCRDYSFEELQALGYYIAGTNTVNLPVTGLVVPPPGVGLARLEYSMNGGAFSPIVTPGLAFEKTFNGLSLSSYSVVVRAVFNNGTLALSAPCNFSFIIGCLQIGGNQFVLDAQQSALSEYGVIQFNANEPQKFYVETQCNDSALIRNASTNEIYSLVFDQARHLWTTNQLLFTTPGNYELSVEISNRFGETKSRQINTVTVVPQPVINVVE